MSRTMTPVLVLGAVVLAGCASAAPGTAIGDRSVITHQEIEESGQVNVLELIQVERPHWLRLRGSQSFFQEPVIHVYIDGIRAGNTEILRDMSTNDVEAVRYYDARRAQFQFGSGHEHGAIEIVTQG